MRKLLKRSAALIFTLIFALMETFSAGAASTSVLFELAEDELEDLELAPYEVYFGEYDDEPEDYGNEDDYDEFSDEGERAPSAVIVEPDEDSFAEIEEVEIESIEGNGYINTSYHPEDSKEKKSGLLKGERLPASYSTEVLPAIKDQGKNNTCWAFSLLGTGEINMLKSKNITKANADSIDFSEWALSYFMYNSVVDPLGLTQGDSTKIKGSAAHYELGGNGLFASFMLSGWQGGAISEASCSYPRTAQEAAAFVPSDDICYNNAAILKGMKIYPYYDASAYSSPSYLITTTEEELTVRINKIKEAVKTNGAVGLSFYYDGWGFAGSAPYLCNRNAGKLRGANHSVIIVGWDDTIASASFDYRPAKDGAWIIRNSYGESEGLDGYDYLSYYDESITDVILYTFDDAEKYDYNYHYDGSGAIAFTESKEEGETLKLSNVYKVKLPEGASPSEHSDVQTLKAVSFAVESPDTELSFSIYKLKDDHKSMMDGELLAQYGYTNKITTAEAGIYTYDLGRGLSFDLGDEFSIIVEANAGRGNNAAMFVDETRIDNGIQFTDAMNSGECYYSYGETNASGSEMWYDCSDNPTPFTPRIKTFLNEGENVDVSTVSIDKTSLSLYIGDTYSLSCSVLPSNTTRSRRIEYSSTNENVAAVSSSGKITAKGIGTATIKAMSKADNSVYAECTVTVTKEQTTNNKKDKNPGGGGGGGATIKVNFKTDTEAETGSGITYSRKWFQNEAGEWMIRNKAGEVVKNVWLCDDAIAANGLHIWYLLDAEGKMFISGLVLDNSGNFYSIETNHNGYYGMLRYESGYYDCNGQKIYLEFSREHDGSFGAVRNPEGLDKLKEIYGVTKFEVGNESNTYTSTFEE